MKYPIVLHPTRVLLVDDSPAFYRNLIPLLNPQIAIYEPINNPVEALEVINRAKGFDEKLIKLFKEPEAESIDSRGLLICVNQLVDSLMKAERFECISTVVVDYDMPEMNGLEFCRQIKDPHVQKIILTGKADERFAIDAFNEGVIQGFLKKGDHDTVDLLNEYIVRARSDYFTKCTSVIKTAIELYKEEPTAIGDPAYSELVSRLAKEHNIVECYLIEGIGSILMVDTEGNCMALFIRSRDNLEAIAGFVEDNDEIKDKLTARSHMLCYRPSQGEALPPETEWQQYLATAVPLVGDYYYGLTERLDHILEGEVYSLDQYVSDLA